MMGILSEGVPPSSPNPDPFSDQKMSFSTPVFRPGLQAEIVSSLLKLECKQKLLQMRFVFVFVYYFLFHSYSFLKQCSTIIHSCSSFENHTQFQTKMGKVYVPIFLPKRPKNHTLWGSTYLYGLWLFYQQIFSFTDPLRNLVLTLLFYHHSLSVF